MLSWIGKSKERIRVEPATALAELNVRPRWSEAQLRFPKEEETVLVGVSSNPGHMHIVEVTVPVTVENKGQSLFVRAMAWFKDKPEAAKIENLNANITKIFKESNDANLEDAFIHYKTLMLRENGATNIEINFSREGRDIIVVDRDPIDRQKHG
jgi:hypothetical protein